MRIGYSFWGFLGPGVTDTPDGGRSHRRPLLDALEEQGHQLVLLQPNRDLLEAGDQVGGRYRFDAGLPPIDALVLEWRWPIAGRNTTACGAPSHTCDLHRQAELLLHYTEHQGIPTVLWDKDRKLPADDPLRARPAVAVCEAALNPTPGAHRLLFPVEDRVLDAADPQHLAKADRPITLAYVGNQYERDEAFDAHFAPAARRLDHLVAGKWSDTSRWPGLNFRSRVPFPQVQQIHAQALATMLLLPDRYARAGQITQRIFEAVLAGCLPLAPTGICRIEQVVPDVLRIRGGTDAADRLAWLRSIAGTDEHADLLAACIEHLTIFRLSTQVAALDRVLRELADAHPGGGNSA